MSSIENPNIGAGGPAPTSSTITYDGAGVLIITRDQNDTYVLLAKEGQYLTDLFDKINTNEDGTGEYVSLKEKLEQQSDEHSDILEHYLETLILPRLSSVLERFIENEDKAIEDNLATRNPNGWMAGKKVNQITNNTQLKYSYPKKTRSTFKTKIYFDKNDTYALYGIPKGNKEKVDNNDPFNTLKRELKEELAFNVDGKIFTGPFDVHDNKGRTYKIYTHEMKMSEAEEFLKFLDRTRYIIGETFGANFFKINDLPKKLNSITTSAIATFNSKNASAPVGSAGAGSGVHRGGKRRHTRRRKSFRKKTLHKKH